METGTVDLEKLWAEITQARKHRRFEIIVSGGSCGCASGAPEIFTSLKKLISENGLNEIAKVKMSGCLGFCSIEPIVMINPCNVLYCHVRVEDLEEIVSKHLLKGEIVDRLLYKDPSSGEKYIHKYEIPFFKKQLRWVLSDIGKIDPLNILDYIALGGYHAIVKAFNMGQDNVISEVKASGLRGRGGGGFPTGIKWELARMMEARDKFFICNAAEGDPGAFVDRSILEGNPHLVIEGMLIGAFSTGSSMGYIYIRNEYTNAIEHLRRAIDQAYEFGVLGKNIFGTGFSFDVEIVRGAWAFICGEETTLIKSIQGEHVEAQIKPPYPMEKGVNDMPTVINNVKTIASVPLIITNGASWFASVGTEKSKGTMVFSLAGKVRNRGLVEVPMGTKLRQIVFDIGGGVENGKRFKALQIGGPAGSCLPESLLDTPADYESLLDKGAIMGAGGLIVMDEDTCMVDIARYFLSFALDESCGKCTPCREGIKHMLDVINKITKGQGNEEDIQILDYMGNMIAELSLCGLGKTAPNPVLSTIKYFRDEYEEHIRNKRCPAGVCKIS